MNVRRVCVWSGKRGGFGALIPTMEAIASRPDMDMQLVVTDQHLYDRFGNTVTEVESQFPIAARIDMSQEGDSNEDRARAIGRCVTKSVDVLSELDPDFLLVIGDRGEVLAACIAAHNMRIAIAHIQGGDISGSLDEPVRHATTKLAHIHFPATEVSAKRIRDMGEQLWRVHVVGDTHLDPIFLGVITPEEELRSRYNLPLGKPVILVLQHSDSSVPEQSRVQMAETIASIKALDCRALLIYPCSDQGYEGIIGEINAAASSPSITIHKNIPAPDFIGLEKLASCLVGNSSAGLIEAPYFALPAINIGARQFGREHCGNVIHAQYDKAAISAAIDKAVNDEAFRDSLKSLKPPFGDGRAFERITDVLANIRLDDQLFNKRMTY